MITLIAGLLFLYYKLGDIVVTGLYIIAISAVYNIGVSSAMLVYEFNNNTVFESKITPIQRLKSFTD